MILGERIKVVVHSESIVHSAVEFDDGVVIAHLGETDMRTAIAYSLGRPERLEGQAKRLDLTEIASLTFESPDLKTFPLLQRAFEAIKADDGSSIVLEMLESIHLPKLKPKAISEIIMFDLLIRKKSIEYINKRKWDIYISPIASGLFTNL